MNGSMNEWWNTKEVGLNGADGALTKNNHGFTKQQQKNMVIDKPW